MKTIKIIITLCIVLFGLNKANAQLDATFYAQDSCYSGPGTYQFFANTTVYNTYIYDFGDGTSDTSSTGYALHLYAGIGSYNVTLTVLDSGTTASSSQTIFVNAPNDVLYTYNGGGSCSFPQVYTFVGAESNPNNPITDWNWIINNQYVGSSQSLTYTFNQPGTYGVELYGYTINGCFSSYYQTITISGASFTANVSSSPSSSCGSSCDGSIMASATGSTGPYTFVLNNGASQTGYQTVFNNLCEGSYTLTVYDQMQCSQVYSSYVYGDSLSQVYVDATSNNGSPCSATTVCQGSIEAFAFGGNPPYQYSIDGGVSFQSSSSFTGLCAGTYVVMAQDVNGCSNVFTTVIAAPDSLVLTSFEYYANCQNDTLQGSYIGVNAQGGSGNYSYLWSDGSTASYISNPTAGTTYSVIVSDTSGCTASVSFDVPINECYTISGHVYVDVNGNCIYDGNDYPINCFVDLTATAGGPWLWIYDYTDATGYYEINTTPGTYFFDINGYNVNNLTSLCPAANYSVTLNSTNQTATVDFFLSPPPPIQDLSISLGHYTNVAPSTIPSQNRWSYIQFCNDGTIPMSGYVEWHYSDELTYAGPPSWSTIVPDIIDQANHTLTFNFTNLLPGDCEYIRINFDVPNNLPIGTVINDEAIVFPIAGDVIPANNTAYTSVLSQGSWDPNDKTVYPNGDITIDDNDHNYRIRFQNEGNANATRVIVRDELDNDLDLHSLRNVAASHDYIMTIENNNTLVFTFNNIQLPPKDVNEAASQGWVSFSISQDGEKPVGTDIENTAAIYFDFNEAVITNTVVNTIVEKVSGISEELIENAMTVSPNPSSGVFNVEITKDIELESLNVYDMMGNRIMTMPALSSTQIQINLQHSASGIYILEVVSPSGKAISKLVKQ